MFWIIGKPQFVNKAIFALCLFMFMTILALAQNSSTSKYADFKSGYFTFGREYEFEGTKYRFSDVLNLDTIRIIRVNNRQTELYPEDGNKYSIYDITWVNDSAYVMTLAETTKGTFNIGDRIDVRILSRTANSYSYISDSKLGRIKATIIKIPE